MLSNRYGAAAGGTVGAPQRNAFLLEKIGGIADRGAFFVCCLVLVHDEDRFLVQETVHGVLRRSLRGENGFGYDPLFLLPSLGMTMAELPDEEKDLFPIGAGRRAVSGLSWTGRSAHGPDLRLRKRRFRARAVLPLS